MVLFPFNLEVLFDPLEQITLVVLLIRLQNSQFSWRQRRKRDIGLFEADTAAFGIVDYFGQHLEFLRKQKVTLDFWSGANLLWIRSIINWLYC